ncbi:sugar ABC transporter substrate-binding protein [Nocardioides sp. BP30]|uniref:sugar ABC transporter substrate-binding protein n=1 Tax=Nocardioides sp. BP30 TaxID=3036374 RepID=UPI002468A6A5|nr:sugar ABC transporter substrate-binding protein [Nocardioides sp. BP30]WGL50786.1 sugar ABC transporter substrate-binding protein [Nocardioides sp. BP30]
MRKTRMGAVAVSAVAAMALAACSSSSGSTTADAPAVTAAAATESAAAPVAGTSTSLGPIPTTKIKVAYASPVQAQVGQQMFDLGASQAAKLSGSTYTSLDSNVDPSKQIANMTTMLQQKPDVIGTWTLDPGSTAGIYGQVVDAKIPLIGTNSNDNGISSTVWTQSQLCESGGPSDQDAKMIAAKYPGGTVVTIGLDGVPSIDSAVDCFKKQAGAAGLKVVAHVSNTSDQPAGAQQLITDTLVRYPDTDAVWSYNDTSALGASAAVIAAGKKVSDGTSDGVMIFGTNGDAAAIKAVKEGRMTRTWDPNSVEFGWVFFADAELAAEGKAPKNVTVTSTGYDKSNVDSWIAPQDRKITSFDQLKYTVGS